MAKKGIIGNRNPMDLAIDKAMKIAKFAKREVEPVTIVQQIAAAKKMALASKAKKTMVSVEEKQIVSGSEEFRHDNSYISKVPYRL